MRLLRAKVYRAAIASIFSSPNCKAVWGSIIEVLSMSIRVKIRLLICSHWQDRLIPTVSLFPCTRILYIKDHQALIHRREYLCNDQWWHTAVSSSPRKGHPDLQSWLEEDRVTISLHWTSYSSKSSVTSAQGRLRSCTFEEAYGGRNLFFTFASVRFHCTAEGWS